MDTSSDQEDFKNPDSTRDKVGLTYHNLKDACSSHKAHVLVFIFAIFVGVGVGVGLNFGFGLSSTPVVAKRVFKPNQVLQYGRILSTCFESTPSGSSDNKEDCNVEKSKVTFYVQNVTDDYYYLTAKIDDYQNIVLNNTVYNTSNISQLSFEDLANRTEVPMADLYYLVINIEGQFVSLTASKNVSDTTLNTMKSLLEQFTPKLNRHLFKSRVKAESSSPLLKRFLTENVKEVGNGDQTTITEKANKDDLKITDLKNPANKITYTETSTFDKKRGVLQESTIQQNYLYDSPKSDVLATNLKANTISKFKLYFEENFENDQSVYVFGQTPVSVSNRQLLEDHYVTHTSLKRTSSRAEVPFEKFASNFEREVREHHREHRVLEENERHERILQTVPKRENWGPPFLIRFIETPKTIFDYKFDCFIETSIFKDFYQDFSSLDNSTSLEFWRSFLVTEYKVIFRITKDDFEKNVTLYSGAVKVNTTLLDMLPSVVAFENEFKSQLQTYQNKIEAFFNSTQKFFDNLKTKQKVLYEKCVGLIILDLCFKVDLNFDLGLNLNHNLPEIIKRNIDAFTNYYDNLKKSLGDKYDSVIAKIPKTQVTLKVDPELVKTFVAFDCSPFRKWTWFFKQYFRCTNPDGSSSELTPEEYEKKKQDLGNAISKYDSYFKDMKNNFTSRLQSWKKEAGESIMNDLVDNLYLNIQTSLSFNGTILANAQVTVDLPFIDLGLKVNGTLVRFNTSGTVAVDALQISKDYKNAAKYVTLGFKVELVAFEMNAWLFYDKIQCDWFYSQMEKIVSMKNNTRMLDFASDVKDDLWSFAKNIQNDIRVECNFLAGDRKLVENRFTSIKIPPLSFNYELTPTPLSDILGKTIKGA